ncbi:AAA family ATPase [Pyxidicoccus parkwayensis]|uniref:non-specific serine/threonine protein kinase n=1 Tax=Pyxidicoccus parkwayensis TaxID=2813578 RepID=A0ABX7NT11_9BACT|nr:ATPase domain-containing protein [Pyxidicoccus parkwaysis]QSQ21920.1 AAA family ATPase [Pyxidicoccus parkwaysis]
MTDIADLPGESDPRVSTGVPGLDTLLRGGWLRGGTYIITGEPGTGKTILGNQFCFSTVARGGKAIYLTVLAESHSRMVLHLEGMSFFRKEEIGQAVTYESGYAPLKADGLAGLSRLIFRAVREVGASALVVDGLAAVEERAESRLAFREFLHGLCVHNALAGCTTLLLTGQRNDPADPQFAMVDGVVVLTMDPMGVKMVRTLEVVKFRGGAQLVGKHSFDISNDGVRVYPRTEALFSEQTSRVPDLRERQPFGIPRLDEMLRGGLVRYSSTLIFGSPGSGKTLLCLHFLAEGARRGEPGLYFGFVETAQRLINKAEHVGLDLGKHVDAGLVHLESRVSVETLPDALVQELFELVKKHRIQRVVLDGLEPFIQESSDKGRTPRFLTALNNTLRGLGVTMLATQQTNTLFGPELNAPLEGVEAIIDNILLLRFVELRSQLYRMLSVLKMRESDNDPALRLFSVTSRGIDVAETFESAEAILTGQARPLPPSTKKTKQAVKPRKSKGLPRRRRSGA